MRWEREEGSQGEGGRVGGGWGGGRGGGMRWEREEGSQRRGWEGGGGWGGGRGDEVGKGGGKSKARVGKAKSYSIT